VKSRLVFLFLLASCASTVKSWRDAMMGNESQGGSRSPASTQELSIENRSGANVNPDTESAGPDLTQNELMSGQQHYNQKSSYGFRRNANPWYGTQADNEGSLWNPDSQDGFLFSKNLLHKLGDIIIVKLESDVSTTMNEKVDEVLGRTTLNQVLADEAGKSAKNKVKEKVTKALGNAAVGDAVSEEVKNRTVSSIDGKAKAIDVENVAVRITAYGPRNTFFVQGARKIYIRNSPYKLKLEGIVRDEDIGPTSIVSSNMVFESKLEIVK
jgi:flagellar basal body L-ring protein FlgH